MYLTHILYLLREVRISVCSFLMTFFVRIVFVLLFVIFSLPFAEANALLNYFDLLQNMICKNNTVLF